MRNDADDVLEVGALLGALWRGRWRIAGGVAVGFALGLVALYLIPRKWEARASVLATAPDAGGAALARAGIPEALSTALLGSAGSSAETEVELLRSRRLLREVADSIPLAVTSRAGRRVPPITVVARVTTSPIFVPRDLRLVGEAGAVRVRDDDGVDTLVPAGGTLVLPEGRITFRDPLPSSLPEVEFTLLDDEAVFRRLEKRITVERLGGELVAVTSRWEDSLTGSAVVNAVVDRYLALRTETDRSDNAELRAFLGSQRDSLQRALSAALDAMRSFQERNEYAEPGTSLGVLLDALTRFRVQAQEASLEGLALDELLSRLATTERGGARSLPSFPAFARSPAINDLLGQLVRLETERVALLRTRTAADPTVAGLADGIALIERQLLPLATTYRSALRENERSLRISADSVSKLLGTVPGVARRYGDLVRDVQRLDREFAAVQQQLLQLQLSTIGEGTGARRIDMARPTREPISPVPLYVLLAGVVLGGVAGVAWVLLRALRSAPASVA